RMQGFLEFTRLKFKWEDYPNPLVFDGRLHFLGRKFEIQNGRFESEKSQVNFTGKYQAGEAPFLKVAVDGKSLVVDELIPRSKDTEFDLVGFLSNSDLFAKGSCEVALEVGRLKYKVLDLNSVSGDLSAENGKFKIVNLTVGTDHKIEGKGLFSVVPPRTLEVKGLLQTRNVPAQNLLALFGDTYQNGLTGRVRTLDLRFQGKGKQVQDIIHSLSAKVDFDLQKGRIDEQKLKRGTLKLLGIKMNEGAE
ncbi:MAG: hypothetical protein GWM98_03700, partial [Nitrospinaceae bacterium]|nr:AsmA-like C-terminal region-containing protein [Nitrospinaceae bacterium]NIR53773.1 AsmA-like C-terminal region-containing protein [Nitrospinaceae bacterium]NIS84183.1 AsmA-like C-terminal region-containing protein [Nitrospinaceae bacterium]NIT80989.1 AsmA-like C-terminal region-containing protein [Nitrospinaceae bacterium]NIU43279.1 AsmA-like C-terminal region-containing protein [Nitrospinaceae bacterium]